MSDVADHASNVRVADSQHRLLLADDNPVNQRVAVHLLSKLGYAVDVVDNGALAVAAAARGGYALLLMDCQMPEMDGFEATAAIRRAEADSPRHQLIIAMTANALQGDREQCLAAGMDDYIAKPIDAARLSEVLLAWLPKEATVPAAALRAVPSAPTLDLASLPIDMKRMTDLFGDDDVAINELLTVFEQSLQPLGERLKREVRDHGGGLKSLAHEIRGAAANIGAMPLAELGGRLEKLAASGNWDEIESLASRVADEFIRIGNFVTQRINRVKG
jgi:CheY-like chemotaxis protein/HPt (histidine-containing phosphotransfer) domain-containing protein